MQAVLWFAIAKQRESDDQSVLTSNVVVVSNSRKVQEDNLLKIACRQNCNIYLYYYIFLLVKLKCRQFIKWRWIFFFKIYYYKPMQFVAKLMLQEIVVRDTLFDSHCREVQIIMLCLMSILKRGTMKIPLKIKGKLTPSERLISNCQEL